MHDLKLPYIDSPAIWANGPQATNTLECSYPRSLTGDAVGDLRVQVLEQGLSLEELKQASTDAEKRRKTYRDELIGMMAVLLKTSRGHKAQRELGGQQPPPTAGAAERGAASLP